MKLFITTIMTLCTLSLTGCSSIINQHQTQKVSFAVVDRDSLTLIPANCTVTSDVGNFFELKGNPSAIEVAKGQSQLLVTCEKSGYYQEALAVTTTVNHKWEYSAMTRITGFIVKTMQGDATQFPSNVVVLMNKVTPYNTPALNDEAFRKATNSEPFFQGRMDDYERSH